MVVRPTAVPRHLLELGSGDSLTVIRSSMEAEDQQERNVMRLTWKLPLKSWSFQLEMIFWKNIVLLCFSHNDLSSCLPCRRLHTITSLHVAACVAVSPLLHSEFSVVPLHVVFHLITSLFSLSSTKVTARLLASPTPNWLFTRTMHTAAAVKSSVWTHSSPSASLRYVPVLV